MLRILHTAKFVLPIRMSYFSAGSNLIGSRHKAVGDESFCSTRRRQWAIGCLSFFAINKYCAQLVDATVSVWGTTYEKASECRISRGRKLITEQTRSPFQRYGVLPSLFSHSLRTCWRCPLFQELQKQRQWSNRNTSSSSWQGSRCISFIYASGSSKHPAFRHLYTGNAVFLARSLYLTAVSTWKTPALSLPTPKFL